MSNQAPFMKLVELVNEQLQHGKSEEEIVSLLISAGLDEAKARQLVGSVQDSRTSHFKGIIIFVIIVLAVLSSCAFIMYTALGELKFVGQSKFLTIVFFLCFILSGIMARIKGRAMAYVRFVISAVWLASSFLLMVAMFLHPGWDSQWFGTGGGWRGQLVSFLGNAIYNIGSSGIGIILALLSMLVLLLFWGEFHRIRTKNYKTT